MTDSTLLSVLHPREGWPVGGLRRSGVDELGSFSVYGVRLHLLCAARADLAP